MRNLKKVLSLALAFVMLLGMMVVGAGAATSFSDADKIENTEAVDVVSGIGVLTGVGDGSFNPEGTLSRAEAAVVIAKLDLGAAFGNLETTNASTFSDVPANHWGKAYIDYCAARGLIAGVGNNRYNPDAKVSGVQFALMVARVLGYEDKAEQVGGADWEVEAAALARKAGLTKDVIIGSKDMTRDEMAQVAYNALKANMVEYKNGTIDITVGGTPVTIGGNPATPKTTNNKHYDGSVKQDNILQLCEEKFPQLTVRADVDEFDRPSNVWTYKRDDIAVIPAAAMVEYTAATKGTTIAKALKVGSKVAAEYYVDGKQDTGVKTVADLSETIGGNGVLTQAWYDEIEDSVKVTVINTFVGRVASVNKAGDTITVATLGQYDGSYASTVNAALTKTFETENFAAEDLVTFTAAYGDSSKKYAIQEVNALTDPATGTLTKWDGTGLNGSQSNASTTFTVGGQDYKTSANKSIVGANGTEPGNIFGYPVDGSATLNVYLDKYDYAIYVDAEEAELNYAVVIGVGNTNPYGSATNGCTLMFLDGTTKEVQYRMSAGSLSGNNRATDGIGDIVRYSVDSKDVYHLTVIGTNGWEGTYAKADLTIGDETTDNNYFVNGKSLLKLAGNSYYTTAQTVFVVATSNEDDLTGASTTVKTDYTVYTGYAGMPSFVDAKTIYGYALVKNGTYSKQADVVYLHVATDAVSGVSGANTYFVKNDKSITVTSNDGDYYLLPAVVDGEETTVKVATNAMSGKTVSEFKALNGFFAIKNVVKNDKDIIVSFVDDTAGTNNPFRGTTTKTTSSVIGTVRNPAERGVLGIGEGRTDTTISDLRTNATYWAYNSKTNVFMVDKDYKSISVSSVGAVGDDLNDLVYAKVDSTTKILTDVIIVEKDDDAGNNNTPEIDAGKYRVWLKDDNSVELFVDADATTAEKDEIAELNQIIAAVKAAGYTVADGSVEKKSGPPDHWEIPATMGAIKKAFTWKHITSGNGQDTWEDAVGIKLDGNDVLIHPGAAFNGQGLTLKAGTYVLDDGTGALVNATTIAAGSVVKSGYVQLTIDSTPTWIEAGKEYTASEPAGATGTGFKLNDGSADSYLLYTGKFTPDATKNYTLTKNHVKVTGADGANGETAAPVSTDYKLPAKSGSLKGTGMWWTIGADKGYAVYDDAATQIPAAKVTDDIVLTHGYVKVAVTNSFSTATAEVKISSTNGSKELTVKKGTTGDDLIFYAKLDDTLTITEQGKGNFKLTIAGATTNLAATDKDQAASVTDKVAETDITITLADHS